MEHKFTYGSSNSTGSHPADGGWYTGQHLGFAPLGGWSAPIGEDITKSYPDGDPFPVADTSFEIGDVVNLIVGGPDMVIIGVCECGSVEVAFVQPDGSVMVDMFPEEALV